MTVYEIAAPLTGLIQFGLGVVYLILTFYRAFRSDVSGFERALILAILFSLSAYIRMGGA